MIEIVSLTPEDRADWQTLFTGYNTFYERTMTEEFYDAAWARFQRDDEVHALGAKLDGRLVGIAHFLVHPSTTASDNCYLQDLFTSAAARGHGVGRALIGAIAAWARERGCGRVYWLTHESNATARALYDKVAVNRGFIQYQLSL